MAVILRNPLIFGIILLISLAVNLFLGGILMGWYLHGGNNPAHPFLPKWDHPPAILQALPEAAGRIQPILQRNSPTIHPKIKQLQQIKREIYRQIATENLDTIALENTFARMRQAELETKTAIHRVFVEVISRLTLEERQRLEQRLPHHEGPGGGRGYPFPQEPPPFSKADRLLAERDQNQDDKLSLEEFLAPLPEQRRSRAEYHFQKLDVDQDGFLTENELATMPPPP
jgi:uncharacterized membrane protein